MTRRVKDVVRGLIRPGARARRYVAKRYACEDFFRELAVRQVRYTVLRWFETLPVIARGEDVDLLVADEDIAKMDDLFVRLRSGLACDVYSVSGLPGSDFQKMAYFPPHLAAGIIARSRIIKQLYRVPAAQDHFLSLAYHALYHKGYASGLPAAQTPAAPPKKLPDHDYGQVLGELAAGLSITVAIDMESLDEYLTQQGWRPPFDMLARLSLRNPWIHDRYFRAGFAVEPARRGLAVFLIRERALRPGVDAEIAAELEAQGFRILLSAPLGAERQAAVASRLRGGNWGRGPFAFSGGPPAQVIVAWDPKPLPVDRRQKAEYPLLENGRILRAKLRLRDFLLRGLARRQRFNPLHSSDNDIQAWEYLEILLPQQLDELRRQLESLHRAEA
ncbi:MAG: hypothetical protein WBO00_08885 [Steroidobacteraceae bacterium]